MKTVLARSQLTNRIWFQLMLTVSQLVILGSIMHAYGTPTVNIVLLLLFAFTVNLGWLATGALLGAEIEQRSKTEAGAR